MTRLTAIVLSMTLCAAVQAQNQAPNDQARNDQARNDRAQDRGQNRDVVQSDALPLDVRVHHDPTWIPARDGRHALYELHIANYGARTLTLERIEVRDGYSQALRQAHEGEALVDRLLRPGLDVSGARKAQLGAGQTAVVFLELIAAADERPSASLAHRLIVRMPPDSAATAAAPLYALDVLPTPVAADPVVIGAPLRGGGWVAANGFSNVSEHRRTLMTLRGRAVIAQRYAIDFIRLGPNGRLTRDDTNSNESFFGYGAELLAVADGEVVETRDGVPENRPRSGVMADPITLDTIAGNYVLLDIDGAYVLYGHAIPGSIRVQPGDKVRRGAVLARLGNSGRSDAPHLHLHVVDRPAKLAAEGAAFVFGSFSTVGRIDDLDAFIANEERFRPSPAPARSRRALPLSGDVIAFE